MLMRSLVAMSALLPLFSLGAQVGSQSIRGEVVDKLGKPVNAAIRRDGDSIVLRTDARGRFRILTQADTVIRLSVVADGYLVRSIVANPRVDTTLHVVLRLIADGPMRSDTLGLSDGLIVAFASAGQHEVPGDSVRIVLQSRKAFGCVGSIALGERRRGGTLDLRANAVVIESPCATAVDRAQTSRSVRGPPVTTEIVVMVAGRSDTFGLRRSAGKLCVVHTQGTATRLTSGAYFSGTALSVDGRRSLESMGAPQGLLGEC